MSAEAAATRESDVGQPRASRWYAPRVVASSSVLYALTAPAQTASISVFVNPLIHGLHLSRSAVSAAYLIGTLTGACAMPLFGRAIDRYGARRIAAGIGLALGAVLLALSAVRGFAGLAAGFAGIRMLGQGALTLTVTTGVAVYIDRRRGLAQGIASAAGSAGISMAPVMLESLVTTHGFRTMWVVEGLAVWALVIPLSLAGLPRHPRTLQRSCQPGPESARSTSTPAADWTRAQALRTRLFWVIAGGLGAVGLLSTALVFDQISLLGQRGLTPAQAAAVFIPQTAAALAATVGTGYLADKVPDRTLIIGSLTVLVVALVSAGYVAPGWSAIGYGVALGIAGNSFRTIEATAFPNCFGTTHLGAIRGIVHTLVVTGSALGPLLLSLGRAWAGGSYRPVLLAMTVLPLGIIAFAAVTSDPPRHPPGGEGR